MTALAVQLALGWAGDEVTPGDPRFFPDYQKEEAVVIPSHWRGPRTDVLKVYSSPMFLGKALPLGKRCLMLRVF